MLTGVDWGGTKIEAIAMTEDGAEIARLREPTPRADYDGCLRLIAGLGELGAVGDVCLRFFDAGGSPVSSEVDRRVIGVTLDQLKHVERSVGVAGGPRKYDAIRGAVLGGWVNVLITDHVTAERMAAERPQP